MGRKAKIIKTKPPGAQSAGGHLLEKELEKLAKAKEQFSKDTENIRAEINQLKTALKAAKEKHQETLAQFKAEIDELKKKKAKAYLEYADRKKYHADIAADLEKQAQVLGKELSELKEKRDAQKQRVGSRERDFAQREGLLSDRARALAEQEKDIAKKKQDLTAIQKAFMDKRGQFLIWEERNNAVLKEISQKEKALVEERERLEELQLANRKQSEARIQEIKRLEQATAEIKDLNIREENLDKLAEKLNRGAENQTVREEELNKRESFLNVKEKALLARERKIKQAEQYIKEVGDGS